MGASFSGGNQSVMHPHAQGHQELNSHIIDLPLPKYVYDVCMQYWMDVILVPNDLQF